MKNLILILSIFIAGNLQAGGVGGGGVSGMTLDTQKIMRVYRGANNISRNQLGAEHLFTLDMKNKTVIFDADHEVLDKSAVLTFEEVAKYALPVLKNPQPIESADAPEEIEDSNP